MNSDSSFISFGSDSPILLSFPHFYMGDQSYRLAVDGISPPEKEKHQLYIDVQPVGFHRLKI
jgi:CD36 family